MPSVKQWAIGRDPQCEIVVDAPGVSSRHCLLTQDGDGFLLEDLSSTNGTFVNGQRVVGRVTVTVNDHVTLGTEAVMPWPNLPDSTKRKSVTKAGCKIRIGRAADNDVRLDYPMVSNFHAELVVVGDRAEIRDLGSSNGTAIGHPSKKITRASLTFSDTVYFGSLRVPARQLFDATKSGGREKDKVIAITESVLVFGRDPACDHVLNYPMISSRHARLWRQGDGLLIEDLNSSNGTYVNGNRIHRATSVEPGDVIGLGSYSFTLLDDDTLQKRDYRGQITLEARQVSVELPKIRLLAPLSLTIYPTELVALMGPSGSGKTTLLNALTGYSQPTAGDIFLNGQNLYEHYEQFRTSIGFVPQDDVMHRDLTVSQALYYTARLRLPHDYTEADIEARIAQVIEQLGLEGTENVLIGSAERKGISGGQRKRVNLAMELLTDPLILFLDEPTSGLSSEDALTVMQLLRKLADEGKTILISIHQPSLEVFRLMDNLIVIGRDTGASAEPGELVYYGPAYPEAVHFFNPQCNGDLGVKSDPSPDEVLRGLKVQSVRDWATKYESSSFYREYVVERASNLPAGSATRGSLPKANTRQISQWMSLFRRGIARKLKDRVNTALLLAQAPVIGLLLVGVFGKQLNSNPDLSDFQNWSQMARGVSSCLFQLAVAALWFGCSNAVREIVGEWAIYHRERMVNLRLGPYVASKFAILGGLCLLQCAILLLIVRWGCNLQGPIMPMYCVMVLMSLAGVALGLVVSAASRTQEIAMALLPVVQLTMVVLGGGMQPVHKLHPSMQLVSYAIPSRWAFESIMLLEVDHQKSWVPQSPPGKPVAQDMAEYHFPKDGHRGKVWHGIAGLTILVTMLVVSIFCILRFRDVH
jgi:ABC-type multidrug transport system ATPase subunit/pSer/pThr/pTyr-binding forkhead associated (FHA) protein